MKNWLSKATVYCWTSIHERMRSVRQDESGQGLVEYGLIIGLVAIVLVAALGLLTGGLQNVFTVITNTLSSVK